MNFPTMVLSKFLTTKYQVSNKVDGDLEFGDIAFMQIYINYLQWSDRYFITDWQFEMF